MDGRKNTGRLGGCENSVRLLICPEEAEALVRLFERVAGDEGWRPGDALRRDRDRSAYFGAHVGGTLAGGLQLVLPRHDRPLPCRAVWPEAGGTIGPDAAEDGPEAAEVLVLALLAPYRGGPGLLWPLCVAMWRFCIQEGVTALLLEATPPTLAVYRRLGFPLEVIGELREHWGEECYLCRMGVTEVAEVLAGKAARSGTYRQVLALAHPGDDPVPTGPPIAEGAPA